VPPRPVAFWPQEVSPPMVSPPREIGHCSENRAGTMPKETANRRQFSPIRSLRFAVKTSIQILQEAAEVAENTSCPQCLCGESDSRPFVPWLMSLRSVRGQTVRQSDCPLSDCPLPLLPPSLIPFPIRHPCPSEASVVNLQSIRTANIWPILRLASISGQNPDSGLRIPKSTGRSIDKSTAP